ncbi:MAG: polysaccharide lyase family 8 super-sandwich domain-containing protein [Opitutaceae bacterium]
MLLACLVCHASDFDLVRKGFVEYYAQQPVSDTAVARYLDAQAEDGTWADVDYASQQRGSWPTRDHLKRLELIGTAFVSPSSVHHQSTRARDVLINGLDHWLIKDYQNTNWWNGRIGVPNHFCKVMVLLGDDLPAELAQRAYDTVLLRTTIDSTGQNKVWLSSIVFMKALLMEDAATMATASDSIWSELRVSTEEGIQPDWSFHQHGAQLQFGNYGISYSGDMLTWALILRGTPYAPNPEKLEVLRNYMLYGAAMVLWGERFDLSACGRQIDAGQSADKARWMRRQLKSMELVDPEYSASYQAAAELPNRVTGYTYFWRSDMAVHRRPNWYASVKMSSTRVIGSETCNSENMAGLHGGDGTFLLYQSGSEYDEMPALWDWRRLPGTTCDQGFGDLSPDGAIGSYGNTSFVGGLAHGATGVAAMIYKRNQLNARKAWFFTEDAVVCLGAGIGGEALGTVLTSVQQSHRSGEVSTSVGAFSAGVQTLPEGSWVHHAGIGYELLSPSLLHVESVDGNWNVAFPTRTDRPVTGAVFSLWIDHGQSPSGAMYAYAVHPQTSVAEMKQRSERPSYRILTNTSQVQAISFDGQTQAVFYAAGTLDLQDGQTVKVDSPCILSLQKGSLSVVDPTQHLKQVTVTIGARSTTIDLPSGAEAGRFVEQ